VQSRINILGMHVQLLQPWYANEIGSYCSAALIIIDIWILDAVNSYRSCGWLWLHSHSSVRVRGLGKL